MRGVDYLPSAAIAGMTDVTCLFAYGTRVRSSRFLSPNQQSRRHSCIARGVTRLAAAVVDFDGKQVVGSLTHCGLASATWTEKALMQ